MESQPESATQPNVRAYPGWIRAVVWLSAAFLTMSVTLGMFLY